MAIRLWLLLNHNNNSNNRRLRRLLGIRALDSLVGNLLLRIWYCKNCINSISRKSS